MQSRQRLKLRWNRASETVVGRRQFRQDRHGPKLRWQLARQVVILKSQYFQTCHQSKLGWNRTTQAVDRKRDPPRIKLSEFAWDRTWMEGYNNGKSKYVRCYIGNVYETSPRSIDGSTESGYLPVSWFPTKKREFPKCSNCPSSVGMDPINI